MVSDNLFVLSIWTHQGCSGGEWTTLCASESRAVHTRRSRPVSNRYELSFTQQRERRERRKTESTADRVAKRDAGACGGPITGLARATRDVDTSAGKYRTLCT